MNKPKIRVNRSELRDILFKFFTYFLICGFLGWIIETTVVSIGRGEFANRGYLFVMKPIADYIPALKKIAFFSRVPFVWGLPIIDIYGFGGVLITIIFEKYKGHNFKLFFYGMIVMSLFELISSYFCTEILRKQFWDYSKDFLNFQGRICMRLAVQWGGLTLLMINYVQPKIEEFYSRVQTKKDFYPIVRILMLIILLCAIVKYIVLPEVAPSLIPG